MNKKVIYTSTFPHKNNMEYFLFEPEVIPQGYDFVCFTNNTNFKSDVWDIRIVPSLYTGGAILSKATPITLIVSPLSPVNEVPGPPVLSSGIL